MRKDSSSCARAWNERGDARTHRIAELLRPIRRRTDALPSLPGDGGPWGAGPGHEESKRRGEEGQAARQSRSPFRDSDPEPIFSPRLQRREWWVSRLTLPGLGPWTIGLGGCVSVCSVVDCVGIGRCNQSPERGLVYGPGACVTGERGSLRFQSSWHEQRVGHADFFTNVALARISLPSKQFTNIT